MPRGSKQKMRGSVPRLSNKRVNLATHNRSQ